MKKTINTGLLAYGMSGKVFHAPFLDKHDGFNLYAIVERTKKQAQQDYPNLISYNSIDELLDDPVIDLVVVNTPNYLHFQHTKAALLKGKNVLVEKPFAANPQQVKEIFELSDKQGKEVLCYQNRRWDSDFISVKEILESGKLGKLNEMHIRYDRFRSAIGPKTFKEELVEACGLQFDLGPHLLDQVISLFGKPVSYHKVLGKNRKDTLVDDYLFIQLTYPDYLNITVTANLLVADPQPAFVLHGSNGSFIKQRTDIQEEQLLNGIKPDDPAYGIEHPDQQGILTLIDQEGNKSISHIPSKPGSYLSVFEAVYQTLIHKKPYPVTWEDILTQLEILAD